MKFTFNIENVVNGLVRAFLFIAVFGFITFILHVVIQATNIDVDNWLIMAWYLVGGFYGLAQVSSVFTHSNEHQTDSNENQVDTHENRIDQYELAANYMVYVLTHVLLADLDGITYLKTQLRIKADIRIACQTGYVKSLKLTYLLKDNAVMTLEYMRNLHNIFNQAIKGSGWYIEDVNIDTETNKDLIIIASPIFAEQSRKYEAN
jgi:hypothetical protein